MLKLLLILVLGTVATYDSFLSFAHATLIHAGKIVDPLTGAVSHQQKIRIEGQKITAIGPDLARIDDEEFINLSYLTILPGLFDAHTHLCACTRMAAESLGLDVLDMVLLDPPAYRALQGAVHAREMLEAGFTTVRDLGNSGKYIDVALKRAIDEGLIDGPTILPAGRILSPFGGQFRAHVDKNILYNDEYLIADSRDDLRLAIRENIYYGSALIKILVDPRSYSYSREDIQFIVDEAQKSGLKVAAHCQTEDGARKAALAGVASIEHGWHLSEDILTTMKQKKISLVSTDFTVKTLKAFGWSEEAAIRKHAEKVKRLKTAFNYGINIAFGSDIMIRVPDETRGSLAIEYLASFVEAGIPNQSILKIFTSNAAQLLGVESERGLLRVGFYADLIGVAENPLEDINTLKDVLFVMKNGKIIMAK